MNAVLNVINDPKTGELLKPKQNIRTKVDTYSNKFTAQAALVSAGSSIEAVRAVCRDQVD